MIQQSDLWLRTNDGVSHHEVLVRDAIIWVQVHFGRRRSRLSDRRLVVGNLYVTKWHARLDADRHRNIVPGAIARLQQRRIDAFGVGYACRIRRRGLDFSLLGFVHGRSIADGGSWVVAGSNDHRKLELGDADCYNAGGQTTPDVIELVADKYRDYDLPGGWILPNDGYGCGYTQLEYVVEELHDQGFWTGLWTENGVAQPLFTQCQWQDNPGNVSNALPTFSWKTEGQQSSYQILVASDLSTLKANKGDLWDSGKITSKKRIGISYAGGTLKRNTVYYWKVRVWTDGDVSEYSEPKSFKMADHLISILSPKEVIAGSWETIIFKIEMGDAGLSIGDGFSIPATMKGNHFLWMIDRLACRHGRCPIPRGPDIQLLVQREMVRWWSLKLLV